LCWTITMLVVNLILSILSWSASTYRFPLPSYDVPTNSTGLNFPPVVPVIPAVGGWITGAATSYTLLTVLSIITLILTCVRTEDEKARLCGRYSLWIIMAIVEGFVCLFITIIFIYLWIILGIINVFFNITPIIIGVSIPWLITLGFCITTSVVAHQYNTCSQQQERVHANVVYAPLPTTQIQMV